MPADEEQAFPVPSPCVNVCRMEAALGLCVGCWRTLDEIAAWSTMGDVGKREVWARVEKRRIAPVRAERVEASVCLDAGTSTGSVRTDLKSGLGISGNGNPDGTERFDK